jgi:hypothetical protein
VRSQSLRSSGTAHLATSAKNSYPNLWRKGILGGSSDAIWNKLPSWLTSCTDISPEDAPFCDSIFGRDCSVKRVEQALPGQGAM